MGNKKRRRGPKPSDFYFPYEWEYSISSVLRGRVEAKLHVITLSGRRYGYSELVNQLGEMVVLPKAEDEYTEYGIKCAPRETNCRITVYVNPDQAYLPWSVIKIRPVSDLPPSERKAVLGKIARKIPGCTLSSAEYTLDIHPEPRRKVRALFDSMKKYLYVPHTKTVKLLGGQEVAGAEAQNRVYKLGKRVKMYERGPDRPKTDGMVWPAKSIDRLRLEHTASRSVLRRHGLRTLEDLLKDAKFFQINSDLWRFKQFKSKSMPEVWQGYLTPIEREQEESADDGDWIGGSFQREFLNAKTASVPKNVTQTLRDIKELSALKYKLQDAMASFDSAWRGAASPSS